MASSYPSNDLIALGRELIKELELDNSYDTLTKWMVHYIAELIFDAENKTGKPKQAAQQRCFEAILQLWQHRAELPNGKRPFRDIEPVVRAIESLDPDDNTPRYFRPTPDSSTNTPPEVKEWLDAANEVDYSAKLLIGYCLTQAASHTIDKSKRWVQLAEATRAEDSALEVVVKFISDSAAPEEAKKEEEVEALLKDRLKRLEGFMQFSEMLASDLKNQIDEKYGFSK